MYKSSKNRFVSLALFTKTIQASAGAFAPRPAGFASFNTLSLSAEPKNTCVKTSWDETWQDISVGSRPRVVVTTLPNTNLNLFVSSTAFVCDSACLNFSFSALRLRVGPSWMRSVHSAPPEAKKFHVSFAGLAERLMVVKLSKHAHPGATAPYS